jgi:hypothetical protein
MPKLKANRDNKANREVDKARTIIIELVICRFIVEISGNGSVLAGTFGRF